MANRIDLKFDELRSNARKGLFPFLVAGQPDLPTTIALIRDFEKRGAAGIELGIPFTDPVADGPVIQSAFTNALDAGVTVAQIFQALADARASISIPLVMMVSASIVYRFGVESFIDRAARAGLDGFIIPDLSFEEAPGVAKIIAARDLRLAMLIAPNTPPDRREKIAKTATGFVYYMSVAGITGERDALPDSLAPNVAAIKSATSAPVLVGFGIKTADQVRQVCRVGDGAIVGSAIVRRIAQSMEEKKSSAQIVEAAGHYVSELLAGLD